MKFVFQEQEPGQTLGRLHAVNAFNKQRPSHVWFGVCVCGWVKTRIFLSPIGCEKPNILDHGVAQMDLSRCATKKKQKMVSKRKAAGDNIPECLVVCAT